MARPSIPGGNILFDYADAEGMTISAPRRSSSTPSPRLELSRGRPTICSALRAMFSTGSPLVPEGFDYVYREIKADLLLSSISGGTDIISCFVLGNPVLPVWRGEIQCAASAWRSRSSTRRRARSRREGRTGLHAAFPGDAGRLLERPDGAKYRAAYFERSPNVWCHGDYSEITPTGHDHLRSLGCRTQPGRACASAPPRSTARSNSCRRSSSRW
jgi:acetoacetyl-CoA synthetase